jgi:class 3 adenylate cyclase
MAAVNARISQVHDVRLAIQIGIHSAFVVVAKDSAGNVEIFGEASDVAALVQAEAGPNTVLITQTVHNLVANRIATEARRALQLAEVGASIPLYRALSGQPNARLASACKDVCQLAAR